MAGSTRLCCSSRDPDHGSLLLILAILINGQVGKQIQKSVPTWILLSAVLITFGWMGSARVIRAMAQSLINRDFVKAALHGVHPFKIVMRHLVPNIGSPAGSELHQRHHERCAF